LQSVFVRIDWFDTLRLERRADSHLQRHDLGTALPDLDLCLRAARCLQQASHTTWGADIYINKHIPSGAGMGGGSADAAAILLGLNTLWALHWPVERLAALALQLGADVPFFVRGQHAWVEGIGEHITPLTLPQSLLNTPLAVLKPPSALPTQSIFTHPNLPRSTPLVTPADFLAAPRHFGHNDMQTVACQASSDVTQALLILQALFGSARMTGSGSAVFAWLPPHCDVTSAQHALQQHLPSPEWTGRICQLLPA
jgi:4-diphosphocytidyl-2-C-methyl-D-erythritol kinase